mmetsp:Transcript_6874/g.12127  ORF Transcript_6874/g.12127 Transcript_6874/m.12127 type:complete len:286 (+) Transcript_6874:47-904(+)
MGNNVPIQHTGNKSFFAHGVHHSGTGTAPEQLPSGEVVATTGGQPAQNGAIAASQGPQGTMRPPAAAPTNGAPLALTGAASSTSGRGIHLDNRDPDGLGLGMGVLPRKDGALQVTSVAPGGAVDAWNSSQMGAAPDACLRPGSVITAVNGVSGNTFQMVTALRKNEVLQVVVSNDRRPEPEEPTLTLDLRGRAAVPRKPTGLPSHTAWAVDNPWDEWAAGVPQASEGTAVSTVPQSSDPPSTMSDRSSTKDKKDKKNSGGHWPSVSFGGTSNHWPSWPSHGSKNT